MVLSSITVLMMLVFIDRMVNGTLYNYGLQFSSDWAFPYQIYFDLGITLVIVNAIITGLGFAYVGRDEKPTISSELKSEALVSTLEVLPLPQAGEEKKEIKPQSSETGPPKYEISIVHHCRYCSFENKPGALFCENCGKNLVVKKSLLA